jgi:hypothetical protein
MNYKNVKFGKIKLSCRLGDDLLLPVEARFDMLPRMVRSPVEICFGISPSQAPKSLPFENAEPSPMAATIALAIIGPIPGTLINRSHDGSLQASAPISLDRLRYAHRADANPQAALDEVQHAWRQDVSAFGENAGQFGAQEAQPLAHRNAALEQEGAYLVDDAGALADQALAHAVQSLQVKLIGSLGGDELHGRALHRLGDRLSIAGNRSSGPCCTGARILLASAARRDQAPAACD